MLRILPAGDAAITFEYGDVIDVPLSRLVQRTAQALKAAALAGVAEIVPTFRSFTVYFDPLVADPEAIIAHVQRAGDAEAPSAVARRVWSVPACYDVSLAPDLPVIARHAGLEIDELAHLHAQRSYFVYMLGFLPGQPYLGNVDERLRLPRLKIPKPAAAGAIGVAMSMSSIWPKGTPCGWNIIARTPALFWQGDAAVMSPGDLVEFRPVTRAEYDTLAQNPAPPSSRSLA